MDIKFSSPSCCENMKRAWRRRKYQRLHGANTKLKIARLGNTETRRLVSESNTILPKLGLKVVSSPIKLFSKFNDAYVDVTSRLVNNMGKANESAVFRGKKVAKDRHVSIISGGDEVDSRLVLKIYKRVAASRDLRASPLI